MNARGLARSYGRQSVLGHIIFAIVANPDLAGFFDEFESAPLQQRVANHQFRWRFRGLDVAGTPPVKAMAESLGVLAAEAKKWPADAAHKQKVFCAVG